MVWNFRLIHDNTDPDPDNQSIALHRMFYDKRTGIVEGWTTDPVSFSCNADEGARGVQLDLSRAITDSLKHPLLKASELQPGVTVVVPPE